MANEGDDDGQDESDDDFGKRMPDGIRKCVPVVENLLGGHPPEDPDDGVDGSPNLNGVVSPPHRSERRKQQKPMRRNRCAGR